MRNRTLDMVKAICAYAVVLLHVHFPGSAGIIANVLARFAVPVFFMVSGYFCFRGDDTEFIRTGKKIRHVLKLMLVAFPVCCLWEMIQNHIDGASQKEWLEALVSGEHIRQFLLYNNSSQVKWHLWFLPALLYCYLLFALAARFRICKQAYVLIPVLLLIHFGMEEFSTFLFPEKHFRVMQFRNYLFTGFPFFYVGTSDTQTSGKAGSLVCRKKTCFFCMAWQLAAGSQVCWNTGILANWNCFWVQYLWLLVFFSLRSWERIGKCPSFRQPSVRNMHFYLSVPSLCGGYPEGCGCGSWN